MRYHWVRDTLKMELLSLKKIYTNDNESDMMAKILLIKIFIACKKQAGLMEPLT